MDTTATLFKNLLENPNIPIMKRKPKLDPVNLPIQKKVNQNITPQPRQKADIFGGSSYEPIAKNVSNAFKGLGTITTPYGGSTKYEKFHPGVDIANVIGTKIPSYSSGKVVDVSLGHKKGEKNGGNYVVIQDAQGNKHRYSHLNNAYVKVGQYLKKGDILGEMGNTGNVYSTSGGTGSHLDYRIVSAFGKYINPNTYKFN